MNEFINFIKPELLVLVIVLYFIGTALKKSLYVPDKAIPLVLGMVGIIIAVTYVLATSALTDWQSILLAIFTAITQGILCSGSSVYIDQIIKQSKK